MEDKQIIELYWNRSEEAIQETEEKYGTFCTYIAHHILQDEEEAERCVKESYAILWDTIPPRRPQNLKGYLCKTTRNHALHMRYPEMNEQESDLFTAELIMQDFLKGLDAEQRKLFIAHYWYFASVAEIAVQYKMSENKVNTNLLSLRQKLDSELEQKYVHLQTEAEWLYAMTEVEDHYLEESAPPKAMSLKIRQDEVREEANIDIKNLLKRIPKKYQVSAIACIVLLVLVVLVWPKNPVEQNPTESDKPNTEIISTDEDDTGIILEDLISILAVGTFHKDDLGQLKTHHPWNSTKEIAALPVYKNLSNVYDGMENIVEYMDEETLTATIEDIATKLNMNIISKTFDKVRIGGVESKYAVFGVHVTTDTGSIEIDARGKVTVSFLDGVQLPLEYDMSDSTTVEHANNKVVAYLMDKYKDIISAPYFSSDSYPTYDTEGNRTMHFRAIVDGEGISDVENILDYNFNQVEFYYNKSMGLTGFSYGDIRLATELLGYYPIISLEEAKNLLQEGNFRSEYFHSGPNVLLYEEEDVLGVELMYKTDDWEDEYQPYYCFYISTAADNSYARCYVPAVKGVRVDGEDIEVEDLLEYLPEEVEIIDMSEYENMDGVYFKDGKTYILKNGAIVEAKDYDGSEDPFAEYGELVGEITDNGTEWILCYRGEPIVNVTRLNFPPDGVGNNSLDAKYIDGQVVVFNILYPNSDSAKPVATVYLYSEEELSLTPIMFSIPLYGYAQPYGLDLKGGRYPTMGNDAGQILIVDLLTGESVNTGILYENIECILTASDEYYAFIYKTGEIALIDKASGKLFKQTKYQLSFTPDSITYQDDMFYIPTDYGNIMFVIKEFE